MINKKQNLLDKNIKIVEDQLKRILTYSEKYANISIEIETIIIKYIEVLANLIELKYNKKGECNSK
jgi:hypothetical protein